MKALIMAGGGGTRLWPLSRDKKPKQFHHLVSQRSLVQMTVDRVAAIKGIRKDDIFISTNEYFRDTVLQQVDIDIRQCICEPAKRDNAAAIGLSLFTILAQSKDPSDVIGVFPSDHIMRNEKLFHTVVQSAYQAASKFRGHVVTLGVRPTYPETGYGYIQMSGEKAYIDEERDIDIFKVDSFTEKPNLETAECFLRSFRYLWNTGIFFFRIDTMLSLYKKYLPGIYEQLADLEEVFGTAQECERVKQVYPTLPATSFDYGILEKTKDVLVVPVDDLGWSDVGHFKSLWEVLQKDRQGNVTEGKKIVLQDVSDSLVYSHKKPIVCLGLKDTVVIDTEDVIFIAHKEESQKIKELLTSLKTKKMQHLL